MKSKTVDEDPEPVAKAAVLAYDPEADFRVWRELSTMWRNVAAEFAEIACGYHADGRANETSGRLAKELADRLTQELQTFAEFKRQFSKTADEWILRQRSDAVAADFARQLEQLELERQAASLRAQQQESAERERRATELERQAAALRSGPQNRTTSYLQR